MASSRPPSPSPTTGPDSGTDSDSDNGVQFNYRTVTLPGPAGLDPVPFSLATLGPNTGGKVEDHRVHLDAPQAATVNIASFTNTVSNTYNYNHHQQQHYNDGSQKTENRSNVADSNRHHQQQQQQQPSLWARLFSQARSLYQYSTCRLLRILFYLGALVLVTLFVVLFKPLLSTRLDLRTQAQAQAQTQTQTQAHAQAHSRGGTQTQIQHIQVQTLPVQPSLHHIQDQNLPFISAVANLATDTIKIAQNADDYSRLYARAWPGTSTDSSFSSHLDSSSMTMKDMLPDPEYVSRQIVIARDDLARMWTAVLLSSSSSSAEVTAREDGGGEGERNKKARERERGQQEREEEAAQQCEALGGVVRNRLAAIEYRCKAVLAQGATEMGYFREQEEEEGMRFGSGHGHDASAGTCPRAGWLVDERAAWDAAWWLCLAARDAEKRGRAELENMSCNNS